AAGIFINSVAQVPFAVLQGAGRPDWTAKLHLLELPLYALLLVALGKNYGLTGIAVAWLARVVLDAVALFVLCGRVLQVENGGRENGGLGRGSRDDGSFRHSGPASAAVVAHLVRAGAGGVHDMVRLESPAIAWRAPPAASCPSPRQARGGRGRMTPADPATTS